MWAATFRRKGVNWVQLVAGAAGCVSPKERGAVGLRGLGHRARGPPWTCHFLRRSRVSTCCQADAYENSKCNGARQGLGPWYPPARVGSGELTRPRGLSQYAVNAYAKRERNPN